MADEGVEWAGLRFSVLHHRDGRMIRAPGLFAFVRQDARDGPLMLFAGQADDLALAAGPGGVQWAEALHLGMDELHVHFPVPRRIDRLQLLSRVVRHIQPLLNVIDGEPDLEPAQRPERRA